MNIGIIGGGAAGMMAAVSIVAHASGHAVTLLEGNKYLGAKVLISGGGRCNVTTGIHDVRTLCQHYPRGGKFLLTAFYHFPPHSGVMEWFENKGVPLKTEDDLRVFPESDNGNDVVEALRKAMNAGGVQIICDARVTAVAKDEKGFTVDCANGTSLSFDVLVVATGGSAYRHTGSTGDGYSFAQALGHTMTPLAPSLSAFTVAEKCVEKISGVAFEKAHLTLDVPHTKKHFERTGPFLFTHKGVTGPAIFALSAYAAYELITLSTPARLTIDFFPEYTKFEDFFQRKLHASGKKMIKNVLDEILPRSMCEMLLLELQIAAQGQASQLTRGDRDRIIDFLQHFSLTITGRVPGDEFVTAGGVSLKEVNPNTMESKKTPGLYFAGEILDVDGFTGGFNLQAAWSTGWLVGESIGKVCA